jgi:hypothetical protein
MTNQKGISFSSSDYGTTQPENIGFSGSVIKFTVEMHYSKPYYCSGYLYFLVQPDR